MNKQEIIVNDSYIIIRQGGEVYLSNINGLEQKLKEQIALRTILPESFEKMNDNVILRQYINNTLNHWLSVNSETEYKYN